MRNICKFFLRVFKTASTFMGVVSWKGGKSILVFKDISNRVGFKSGSEVSLLIITSLGIVYTISFTRLPEFWSKFDPNNTDDESLVFQETQSSSCKKTIPIIITIFRAPFNMLNTYAGCQAILSMLGLDPTGVVTNILCCYSAISNQAAFNIYTYKSIKKNYQRLTDKSINCSDFDFKRFLLKFFLDLGSISYSATCYFISRSCLINNPWARDNLSMQAITIICGLSCGSAFVGELSSRILDLHYLIDHNNDFIKNIRKSKSFLFYPHALMGLIYTLSMAVAYYMGCLNLSEDASINDELIDAAWYTVFIYLVFGISGGALEFAFAVEPMFKASEARPALQMNHQDGNVPVLKNHPSFGRLVEENDNDDANKAEITEHSPKSPRLLWQYQQIKDKIPSQPSSPSINSLPIFAKKPLSDINTGKLSV